MNTIAIILGCLGCLSVGICLGVNLTSNNGKMARKILDKSAERDKKACESLKLISQKLLIIANITNEKKVKDEIFTTRLQVDRLVIFFS